jgi:adenylate kinase family enzyme
MRRVIVVGTTGSGKTVLARRVSERLGLPFFDLDALYWGPRWTPHPLDQFRDSVRQALSGDAWATGGNYSKVRDIVWTRADALIWLDYALPLILWRLLRRTARRILSREELWAGNRETFRAQFLSRDSLFLYALRSHSRQRRQYPLAFSQPEHAHLAVQRFRNPRDAQRWLDSLPGAA